MIPKMAPGKDSVNNSHDFIVQTTSRSGTNASLPTVAQALLPARLCRCLVGRGFNRDINDVAQRHHRLLVPSLEGHCFTRATCPARIPEPSEASTAELGEAATMTPKVNRHPRQLEFAPTVAVSITSEFLIGIQTRI